MEFIALFSVFVFSAVGATNPIEEFIGNIPSWETEYKTATVTHYDNTELRERFESLRREGDVPAHIHSALETIINYPTGKDTLVGIVASVEPRMSYVESVLGIVDYIGIKKDAPSTALEALKIAFGLIHSVDHKVFTSAMTFNLTLRETWQRSFWKNLISLLVGSIKFNMKETYLRQLVWKRQTFYMENWC